MGDGVLQEYCQRFIKEFEDDAIKTFAPTSPGITSAFKKFYLDFDTGNFEVRLYGLLEDAKEHEEHEAMFTQILFSASWPDDDWIELIAQTFGLEEDDVVARMKRAKLIEE